MYESLAGVYDFFAYDFDYDAWTKRYLDLLKAQKDDIKELCDVGCGTGEIAIRLIRSGLRVTGVDLSEDMLNVASDKARRAGVQLPLVRQDMRCLRLPHKTDAILCACDGVNYLTKLSGAEEFFASAFACLKPGGALAFDVSNTAKLSKMGRDGVYFEDTADRTYLWQNSFDEETRVLRMDIRFFLRGEDGKYTKTSETHVQRAHSAEEITALLKKTGYENITVCGSDTDMGEGPGGQRIYFSARKPK